MYIVQNDQILMEKDENDTFWLPYTWYKQDTDMSTELALEHTLTCRKFTGKGVSVTNLGTSRHARGKLTTHFALVLQDGYLGDLWTNAEWKTTRSLFFSLLDQKKCPETRTEIELQYDTHHMGSIGLQYLKARTGNSKLQNTCPPPPPSSLVEKNSTKVACLLLWYPGSTCGTQKVLCYRAEPDFWGFPGGHTRPLEAYVDALRRTIQQDCDFPNPVQQWIDTALSRQGSSHLTHLTQDAHPDFKPSRRIHQNYTI